MQDTYTKGDINRLGDKIREEKKINNTTLQELQNYRITYKEPLSNVFNIICKHANDISRSAIVTYRIKRINSIIGKLSRYNNMQFSRMWDIGGCRCIFKNNEQVYKLYDIISNQLNDQIEVKKINDYISEPQDEGYKSLHLYVKTKTDEKVIEIQIRNQVDHNWATLVEITDLLFDSRLKEYKQEKNLLRFHFLLSKINELSLSEKNEIANVIKKYSFFEKLSDIFSRNYILVRKNWHSIESKFDHRFFLIESNLNEAPRINSFVSFSDAEEKYFEVYKSNQNANIVLTHLPKPSYEKLSIAYSNYILTFHSFLNECFKILENLIEDSLCNKKFIVFFKIYYLYNTLVYIHMKNLVEEVNEFNLLNKNNDIKTKGSINNRKKGKEWINDIKKQVKGIKERSMNFQNTYRRNIPRTFNSKIIIRIILTIIYRKFNRKVMKLLKEK